MPEPLKVRIEVDTKQANAAVDVTNSGVQRVIKSFQELAARGSKGIDALTSSLTRSAAAARGWATETTTKMAGLSEAALKHAKEAGYGITQYLTGPFGAAGKAVGYLAGQIGGFGSVVAIGVLALGFLAAGAIKVAVEFGKAAEQIENGALTTGLGVRAYQEMTLAAEGAGTGSQTLIRAMAQLNEGLSQNSTEGRKVKNSLHEIGVEATDTLGRVRPASDLIGEIAGKLAAVSDPAEKSRLAFHLFGRGAKDLLPVLQQYPELIKAIRASGVVISDEQLQRAGEFDNKMDRIRLRIDALKNAASNRILVIVDSLVTGPLEKMINGDLAGGVASQFAQTGLGVGGFFGLLGKAPAPPAAP